MHLSPQYPTNVRKNLHQFNILMQIFSFLKESFSLFYNLLTFFINHTSVRRYITKKSPIG